MRTELTEMASVQARWLALRQEAVATNVANASLPGFKAHAAPAFADVLDVARGELGGERAANAALTLMPSRNTVDLASELVEGSAVTRAHALNAGIAGAFHRMAMMVSQ